ncbi:MAG: hypothetical protein ETSY2_10520 [Candidatus Entotheonella gemina]|uniref:Uncharacterized protein n=1 Tax=Candidatus Entotheonella gemina TaxID=1429439 RepID=W4MBG6_9BACT|nr:MAG: hypothetical protein ETSY2_10520 [Candidatus Entotheonella gemina]
MHVLYWHIRPHDISIERFTNYSLTHYLVIFGQFLL